MRRARRGAFILGTIIVPIALLGPLDIFGMSSMFTVHMIQHLLLSLVVPPLVIWSIPAGRLHQQLSRPMGIERGISILTIPLVSSALFTANLSGSFVNCITIGTPR